MMIDLLAKEEGNKIISNYEPELLKEYAFWMKGAGQLKAGAAYRNIVSMPGGEILNRYWDDSNTPREEAYKNDLTRPRNQTKTAGLLPKYQDSGRIRLGFWFPLV